MAARVDLVKKAINEAVKRFGDEGDGIFNAAGFGVELMREAGLKGAIDGRLVRAILSARSDDEGMAEVNPESPEDRCAREKCGWPRKHHNPLGKYPCNAFVSAPTTAESPWATVDRLRADLALRTEQFVALGKELTEAKAQLGRAVEYIRSAPLDTRVGNYAVWVLARMALIRFLAPSQPEPLKAHAFMPPLAETRGSEELCDYGGCGNPYGSPCHAPVKAHAFVPMRPPGPPPECRVCGNPDGPPWHAAAVG